LPYLVKNNINGFLVETKNHKKVAEKINYILRNSERTDIKKMKEENMKIGKGYSWISVAEKMENLYTQLIRV
jgi:glycosyltransferase involved in cell wall biosynthesis